MSITLLFFGQIAEITGTERIELEGISDTDLLTAYLLTKYPSLTGKQYRVSVNKKLTNGKTSVIDGDVVALLPPFAGG